MSLRIEFSPELVAAAVGFAEELVRRRPGADNSEAVIAFVARYRELVELYSQAGL